MKHGKNPTVAQAKLIADWGLNPDNWLVIKNLPDKLVILHRHQVQVREIPKKEVRIDVDRDFEQDSQCSEESEA